jgi:hypothetical protein
LAELEATKARTRRMMMKRTTRSFPLSKARRRPAAPRKPRSRRFRLDYDKRGSLAPRSKKSF